nr:LysR substrate-binding domain-containing protein [Paraburkholderia phytofirmans]
MRLFQRSTRKLTLTEAGERFLVEIGDNLDALQAAIASVSTDRGDLADLDGIVMRSSRTGRVHHRTMRNAAGGKMPAQLGETIMVNDPAAMREAAILGLGVAPLTVSDVLSSIERGELVRLLPRWYADAGAISIYYATRALLPAKTRVFVDFVVEAFERERLAERFAGSIG